jgi:hypothetical protein
MHALASSASCHDPADDLDQLARRYRALAARLGELGYISPGSLLRRYTTCGKPGCRCQASPPQPHGPYYQLTRTIAEMEEVSRQATELLLSPTPKPEKTPGDQPA